MSDLETRLAALADDIADTLASLLPRAEVDGVRCAEARLLDAMRYASEGGKRLRAFLAVETALIFGTDRGHALRVGAAIECIHAYSLVHDDLPSMDDDDLRRGRPTTHRAFDEATAILAGDALQTMAFTILADAATHENPFIRCALVACLARASGARGMVGGQMIDIEAESADAPLSLAETSRLQRMKTGALIEASCALGAILGHASAGNRRAVEFYARDFGLAFQIRDDLLDATGDARSLGKAVAKDAAAGKATFVDLLGIEGAKARAALLTDQAKAHLSPLGARAAPLRALADHALTRVS